MHADLDLLARPHGVLAAHCLLWRIEGHARELQAIGDLAGEAASDVPLLHPGGEDVEQHLAVGDRLLAIAHPGAPGLIGILLPLPAQLDHRHVVPAKAGAVIIAQAPRGSEGIAYTVYLAVADMLNVQQQPVILDARPRQTTLEHLRDVEIALLGEEPAVVVELLHLQHLAPAQATAQLIGELALPAELEAVAPGVVGAVVGESARVGGKAGEASEPLGREALVGDHRRDAEGVVLVELPRPGGRDEQLLQVHPGLAGAEGAHVAAAVLGVHAAVGEDRDAQGLALGELAVVTGAGDHEGLVLALAAAGHQVEGAWLWGTATLDRVLPAGREELGADIGAVANEGHAGRIGGRGEAVLGKRGAGTGHALVDGAVAVGEVAVGGQRLGGCQRRQQQEGVLPVHGVPVGGG